MASFITRVELHNALGQNYEVLHLAMEGQGFSRKVKSNTGTWYLLPTAEYSFEGAVTRSTLLEKAKIAATKTGKSFSIILTESAGQTWYNLPTAK